MHPSLTLPARHLALRQLAQNLDAAIQRRVACGVADAEVRVLLAEGVAGNDEQVIADRLRDELAAGSPRSPREKVERSTAPRDLEAVLERAHQAIALLLVIGGDR